MPIITHLSNPEFSGSFETNKLIPFEIRDFRGDLIASGNYLTEVRRSNVTGTLVFRGRIRNVTAVPGVAITFLRMSGFGFVDTDVATQESSSGNVAADQVERSVSGDSLLLSFGADGIVSPESSKITGVLTNASDFNDSGTVTITASTGGPFPFSTTIQQVFAPVAPPLGIKIGDPQSSKGFLLYPLTVTGAAQGLVLKVQRSQDLSQGSWIADEGLGMTFSGTMVTLFGESDPMTDKKLFFRVVSELPQ